MDATPALHLQAGFLRKVHTFGHTILPTVGKTKLALSLDAGLVAQMDALVRSKEHPSRSAAVEAAIRAYLKLARDAAYNLLIDQLDPEEEKALAEEWYAGETFG
ncbi:MAG: ribbon-helix-helix domain-containing protein [Thermoplasmatota archaeon]